MIGRIEIEADDVADLLDEKGIGGELEALGPMRLDAEQLEVALHGVFLPNRATLAMCGRPGWGVGLAPIRPWLRRP